MIPITILLEPMTECMLLGLLSAWAVFYLFYWDPISFFLIHVLVWFLMDWILIHIVQNGSLPCNKFEFLVSKIDPMRQILTWVESLLYIRCNLRCLYLYLLFHYTKIWLFYSFDEKWPFTIAIELCTQCGTNAKFSLKKYFVKLTRCNSNFFM